MRVHVRVRVGVINKSSVCWHGVGLCQTKVYNYCTHTWLH